MPELTKTFFYSALCCVLPLPALAAEGDEVRASLQATFSESLHDEFRDVLIAMLESKGLSVADAEPVVDQFSEEMAGCVLDGLEASLERRSLSISNLSPDMDAEEIGAQFVDVEEIDSLVKPCYLAAIQNAGIQNE